MVASGCKKETAFVPKTPRLSLSKDACAEKTASTKNTFNAHALRNKDKKRGRQLPG